MLSQDTVETAEIFNLIIQSTNELYNSYKTSEPVHPEIYYEIYQQKLPFLQKKGGCVKPLIGDRVGKR